MSLKTNRPNMSNGAVNSAPTNDATHVVLMVQDHQDGRPELKQILKLGGYRVIDTDNGQEAARHAREVRPDLLLLDLDVPLLYELVAARQIIKHALLGSLPVVIVTHEEVVDPAPLIEVGTNRNEYVTRLSDYEELQPLLDYLLPILPRTDHAGSRPEVELTLSLPSMPVLN